jgi:hypothetical protein
MLGLSGRLSMRTSSSWKCNLSWGTFYYPTAMTYHVQTTATLLNLYAHGGGNISAIAAFMGAEWQPGHRQYYISAVISPYFFAHWSFLLLPKLTLVAPGNVVTVPSYSTHLINASLVTGACFSRTSCSMHWLEFITSKQAYSAFGHWSWTAWVVAPITRKYRASFWALKDIVCILSCVDADVDKVRRFSSKIALCSLC